MTFPQGILGVQKLLQFMVSQQETTPLEMFMNKQEAKKILKLTFNFL